MQVADCSRWSVHRQWSFAVNGPTIWNSLRLALRAPELPQNAFYIRALNTHLFSSAQHAIPAPNINTLTDLLIKAAGSIGIDTCDYKFNH